MNFMIIYMLFLLPLQFLLFIMNNSKLLAFKDMRNLNDYFNFKECFIIPSIFLIFI